MTDVIASDFMERISASETIANDISHSLDSPGRWLVKHAMFSNPYIGDGQE